MVADINRNVGEKRGTVEKPRPFAALVFHELRMNWKMMTFWTILYAFTCALSINESKIMVFIVSVHFGLCIALWPTILRIHQEGSEEFYYSLPGKKDQYLACLALAFSFVLAGFVLANSLAILILPYIDSKLSRPEDVITYHTGIHYLLKALGSLTIVVTALAGVFGTTTLPFGKGWFRRSFSRKYAIRYLICYSAFVLPAFAIGYLLYSRPEALYIHLCVDGLFLAISALLIRHGYQRFIEKEVSAAAIRSPIEVIFGFRFSDRKSLSFGRIVTIFTLVLILFSVPFIAISVFTTLRVRLSYVPEVYEKAYGWEPLHYAAAQNDTDKIRELLNKGGDVDEMSGVRSTPLLVAAERGSANAVKILLEAGAAVEAKDMIGRTPLHLASGGRVPHVFRLYDGDYPVVPLREASYEDYIAVMKLLIDAGADVNAQAKFYGMPLHGAPANGSLEGVRLLIDSGAKVDARDHEGNTPLFFAVYYTRVDVAKLLVVSGADVNARDNSGRSVVHYVSVNGRSGAMALAIKLGSNVNAKDNDGKAPLHLAAEANVVETIKILADAGANIDIKDADGLTPLYHAVMNRQTPAAAALVDSGADKKSADSEGRTPYDLIVEEDPHNKKLLELLKPE